MTAATEQIARRQFKSQEIEYTGIGQLDGSVSSSLIQPSAQVIDGVKARIKDICLHEHSGVAECGPANMLQSQSYDTLIQRDNGRESGRP